MAASLERREGGAFALFINSDLQFDSSDERIYHEALVLPALAVAVKRIQSPLQVLVIGGGDGLVAREVFKSSRVTSLDLVDYDPEIVAFAKEELSELNEKSLDDPRMVVHIRDAWDFVEQALAGSVSYDVIISDLTVAENVNEARFHSVEWYSKLTRLLSPKGVLAVNGVSPQATPRAYWSIFNSIVKAALWARPYHIVLPSFSASGFGNDWGFFVASKEEIVASELDADLDLIAAPREYLLNAQVLRRLFVFADGLFAFQPIASPALAGSDILLQYFASDDRFITIDQAERDAFSLDQKTLFMPEADSGAHILPPDICTALAKAIRSDEGCDSIRVEGVQLFLHEVLDLMPTLQREQTSTLIADFLQAPSVFLQAVDLPGLIKRLLRRAAELPAHLVTELKLLQEKTAEWVDNQENLLTLGHRVVSVLILAIVVGNLLYPDAVYAKGTAAAGRGGGNRAGRGSVGRRGWGYNNGWSGTNYYNNRRVVNPRKGPMGPGPSQQMEKDMRQMSLPQRNDLSSAQYGDEHGNLYPVRLYPAAPSNGKISAVYRLGPGTDILANGHMAMPLTDQSYFLITPQAMQIIDKSSGNAVMSLQNDPLLLKLTNAEVTRQRNQFAETTTERTSFAQTALHYLDRTTEVFKQIEPDSIEPVTEPIAQGIELFPSCFLTADGRYLAVNRAGGQTVYIDGENWYASPGSLPVDEPYPVQFKSVAVSYLTKIVRDNNATSKMLLNDKAELVAHLATLNNELQHYEIAGDNLVSFGTRKLPRAEAVSYMHAAMRRTGHQIEEIDRHLEQLPKNVDIARIALTNLSEQRNLDNA